MTRGLALLFAALTMLSGAGHAQAQGLFDMRDIMGGGPSFRGGGGGGGSPIQRTTVSYPANYAPGTIVISTGERRLYLARREAEAEEFPFLTHPSNTVGATA